MEGQQQMNEFSFQIQQQLQQLQQQQQQLQQHQQQQSQYNNSGNNNNSSNNQGNRNNRSHPYEQRDRSRNRTSGSGGSSSGGGRINSGGGNNGGNKGRTGPMRRGGGSNQSYSDDFERDRRGDKVERERPSRTLFVRNINYSVPENTIREMFEQYGEIKRFFNLIEKRGMCFVTYYDSRAAERAKKETEGTDLSGRAIDVHFALPKDEENGSAPEDKNTGTLFVILRNNESVPSNSEVKTFFEKWGEVREVRDCKNNAGLVQKFVEFYDLRACDKAFTEAANMELAGGTLDIKFAFNPKPKQKEKEKNQQPPSSSNPPVVPQPALVAPNLNLLYGLPFNTLGLPPGTYINPTSANIAHNIQGLQNQYVPVLPSPAPAQANPPSPPHTQNFAPAPYANNYASQAQLLQLLLAQQQQQQQQLK